MLAEEAPYAPEACGKVCQRGDCVFSIYALLSWRTGSMSESTPAIYKTAYTSRIRPSVRFAELKLLEHAPEMLMFKTSQRVSAVLGWTRPSSSPDEHCTAPLNYGSEHLPPRHQPLLTPPRPLSGSSERHTSSVHVLWSSPLKSGFCKEYLCRLGLCISVCEGRFRGVTHSWCAI